MVHSIRNVKRVASKILFYNKIVGVFDCVLIRLTSMKHTLYFVSIRKEEASNFRKKAYLRAQVRSTVSVPHLLVLFFNL